jgi:hypothetical protein
MSKAARQFAAWLSPTSAIVPFAASAGTPNSQTFHALCDSTIVHGEFGRSRACAGVGVTV